jgi:putative transcriptional regulator
VIQVALKDVLRERKISLRGLARKLGRHPDTISKFGRQATGGVSYDLLNEICSALACEPGELLRFVPEPPEQMSIFPENKLHAEEMFRANAPVLSVGPVSHNVLPGNGSYVWEAER